MRSCMEATLSQKDRQDQHHCAARLRTDSAHVSQSPQHSTCHPLLCQLPQICRQPETTEQLFQMFRHWHANPFALVLVISNLTTSPRFPSLRQGRVGATSLHSLLCYELHSFLDVVMHGRSMKLHKCRNFLLDRRHEDVHNSPARFFVDRAPEPKAAARPRLPPESEAKKFCSATRAWMRS